MSIESKFVDKPGEEKRDETLKLNQIDTDYLERLIRDDIDRFTDTHYDYFERRSQWMLGIRDLQYRFQEGHFENASDLHVPYTLIMAKGMHARLFQTFSARNLFSVEATNVAFQEKEEVVKNFMNWGLTKWMNRGQGFRDSLDKWLQDISEDGSSALKLTWDVWENKYLDLDVEVTETEGDPSIFVDEEDAEIAEGPNEAEAKVKNVKRTVRNSAPRVGVIGNDDLLMPPGYSDPQEAPWVAHRVILRDDDLKLRAKTGRFDKDKVEEALEMRKRPLEQDSETRGEHKRRTERLEGINRDRSGASRSNDIQEHTVYEWYGRAYIDKDVKDEDFEDIDKMPEEIVIWFHGELDIILGWTYLHRIAPSGRRPIYKADFMPSKERAFGIGCGELLFSLNNHIDAMHNLKMDNGMLSSMQFGFYRAGSSFKPDTFKLKPGALLPVEDVNDVKMSQIPYLGQFGESEEFALTGYGEKALALNDINLGNVTGKGVAGALRNATGANFIDRQANIQINPHLDRISRALNRFFSDFFILCRSRMKNEIFFRVTGEDGKPVFGDIKREDLAGEFDFITDTDIAASSEQEKQQRASLMLQTLLNPTMQQFGILQPGNLYEVVKEFLVRHQVKNPDKFITKPADYQGPALTPETRIFKILIGQGDDPPIENTVRVEEDHQRALDIYERFKESDRFGLFDRDQLAAFASLVEKHETFVASAQGAQGLPNITGTQFSNEGGLPAFDGGGVPDAGASEGGPLGSPVGEPNGPVV